MTDNDLIAAFLKKGGAVTKVETGARAFESDRDIYKAMREGGKASPTNKADVGYREWERGVQDAYLARTQGIRD